MRSGIAIGLLALACTLRAAAGELEITVANIREPGGTLLVAIYDKADHWLSTKKDKPPFRDAAHAVSGEQEAVILVNELPPGDYAVSVFHDLNANHELDTNFIGFPKEPFGFSGPMGRFGPPAFDEARFHLGQGRHRLRIELN